MVVVQYIASLVLGDLLTNSKQLRIEFADLARALSGGMPELDLSGSWLCVDVEGDMGAVLEQLGVPWLMRKIAKVRPPSSHMLRPISRWSTPCKRASVDSLRECARARSPATARDSSPTPSNTHTSFRSPRPGKFALPSHHAQALPRSGLLTIRPGIYTTVYSELKLDGTENQVSTTSISSLL